MPDNKDKVIRYNGLTYDDNRSYVVFDSRGKEATSNNTFAEKGDKTGDGGMNHSSRTAEVLNQIYDKTEGIKKNTGIWRQANAANTFSTYAQRSLESLRGLTDGDNVIVYDAETLGTFQRKQKNGMSWYAPTEIALVHTQYKNGRLTETGKSLSLLLNPTKPYQQKIQGLIDRVATGDWLGLTDDQRRTLSDLTLYAGSPSELFDTKYVNGRPITTVKSQSRHLHPMAGSILSSSKNIDLMRQGLHNLMKYGTDPKDMARELNSFMSGMSNVKFAGQNVYGFDHPVLTDFFKRNKLTGVQNKMFGEKAVHLDGLHLLKTLELNPYSKFGDQLTLERIREARGMNIKGDIAHHALSDSKATVDALNMLLENKSVIDHVKSNGKSGKFPSFDMNTFGVGDKVFSFAGMGADEANPYDDIFIKKDKKFEPAFDPKYRTHPLYKNTTYQIERYFEDEDDKGNKRYGVLLYNESDELYHTIYRNSKHDLQDFFHNHLQHIDGETQATADALKYTNRERARRKWDKMFDASEGRGGGVTLAKNMLNALDITKGIEADIAGDGTNLGHLTSEQYKKIKGLTGSARQKEIQKIQKEKILGMNKFISDGFVRDFRMMRGRLEGEREWLEGFVNRLQGTNLSIEAQNVAMQNFGKQLNETFGKNLGGYELPLGVRALNLDIDGKASTITMASPTTIKGQLYGALYQGAGQPSHRVLKQRYKQLISQLQALDPREAKRYKDLMDALDTKTRPNGEKIDNLLVQLSHVIDQHQRDKQTFGLGTIRLENPTKVQKGRKIAMQNAFASGAMNAIMDDSIASGQASGVFFNYEDKKSVINIPEGTAADRAIKAYDEAIKQSFGGMNFDQLRGHSIEQATNTRAALTKVARSYMSQGMAVQLLWDGKRRGLTMAMANHEDAKRVLNGDIAKIRNSQKAIVVDLPSFNSDGTITLGTQNRVSRPVVKKSGLGGEASYQILTPFNEVLENLTRSAPTVKRILRQAEMQQTRGAAIQASNYLNSSARKTLRNMSMNNRRMNASDANSMFDSNSSLAQWMRGNIIDISDYAEEWYRDYYNGASQSTRKIMGLRDPEKILERAKEGREIFANSMSPQAKRIFLREFDDWAKRKFNLKTNLHSVKDVHALQYLRGGASIQQLGAFGFLNRMSRENIMKSVNYDKFDRERVQQRLSSANMSQGDIDRLLTRGIVTDRASEILGNEVAYLNVRTAYMDDKSIYEKGSGLKAKYKKMLDNKQIDEATYKKYIGELDNLERWSTYDGAMLVADDVAKAFEIEKTKNIRLEEGAVLNENIMTKIKDSIKAGVDVNDLNIRLSDVEGLNWDKTGKITVGTLMKEDGTTANVNSYRNWNRDIVIRGWNAEENTLVLGENMTSARGTKIISDTGLRATQTIISRQILEDLTGHEGVGAVSPLFEPGKGLEGTEVYKYVNLAVDELKRQVNEGSYTVGQMKKDELIENGLRQIQGLMKKHLGVEDAQMKVVNDQIILSEFFGVDRESTINFKKLAGFISGFDKEFKTDFANQTPLGVIGLARQSQPDWENSVGLVDRSREGLVKYGRKELDMISARLGDKSEVVGWLRHHLSTASKAQTPEIDRIASALTKTVFSRGHETPGTDDLVIRTTGPAIGPEGRIVNGTYEMSMNSIHDLPTANARDAKFTAGDYAKTIIDYRRAADDVFRSKNGRKQVDPQFRNAMKRNNGTALLELPDNVFSRKYVRLIDFGDIQNRSITDTPILGQLEKHQAQLWRKIKEYQNLGRDADIEDLSDAEKEERTAYRNRLVGEIENVMADYDRKTEHIFGSSRKGSLVQTFGAAKMDMAGRFRIQGVNPFASYTKDEKTGEWKHTGKYKEGTVYVSRERLTEMIVGEGKDKDAGFRKIARHMNIRTTMGDDVTHLKGEALQNTVLDHVQKNGLYGFVNRYPTIRQSTIQALKIEIDDSIDPNDRTALMSVGTAKRFNADYDGDFLSIALTHYKGRHGRGIHEEMAKAYEEEARANMKAGAEAMLDLEKAQTQALNMGLTVSELAKADLTREGNEDIRKFLKDNWNARTSKVDDLESMQARLNKEFIGFVDNTRDKVLDLTQSTYDLLEGEGLLTKGYGQQARSQVLETFLADFSQNMISSKKFQVDTIERQMQQAQPNLSGAALKEAAIKEIQERYLLIEAMNEAVLNPTAENEMIFKAAESRMQLFGEERAGLVNEAFGYLREVHNANIESGGFKNEALGFARSEGRGINTTPFLRGERGMIAATDYMKNNVLQAAKAEGGEAYNRVSASMQAWEDSVIANFARSQSEGTSTLLDTLTNRGAIESETMLQGHTASERAGAKLGQMMDQFSSAAGFDVAASMKTAGWGGALFGGIWAASAALRSGPTPEGLQEQAPPPPVAPEMMSTPVARISENNGETINLQISAKDAGNLSQSEIAALVNQELSSMTSMQMNMNLNVQDNMQNIDQQWLQGVVANAIDKGFGF